jgi:hypothetical protein
VLIYFAPDIASTGPFRDLIIARINRHLNGTLSASDLTLGWWSIELDGVRILDPRRRLIFDVRHVSARFSLIDTLRGRCELHHVVARDPNFLILQIDPAGMTNFDRLLKGRRDASAARESFSVRGDVVTQGLRAMLVLEGAREETRVYSIDSANTVLHVSPEDPTAPDRFMGNLIVADGGADAPLLGASAVTAPRAATRGGAAATGPTGLLELQSVCVARRNVTLDPPAVVRTLP